MYIYVCIYIFRFIGVCSKLVNQLSSTIRETLEPKIKVPVRALNLQDVVTNIMVGFASKENTERLCTA